MRSLKPETKKPLKNHTNMDSKHWKNREPSVTQDPEFKREWLPPEPLRYFVQKDAVGLWSVCDRWLDIPYGKPAKTRSAAIRQFYNSIGRTIPTGSKLPEF